MHLQDALNQSDRYLAIRTEKHRPERSFICDSHHRAIILELSKTIREARPEEIEGFLDWEPLNE